MLDAPPPSGPSPCDESKLDPFQLERLRSLQEYRRQATLSFDFNFIEGRSWGKLSRVTYWVATAILATVAFGCAWTIAQGTRFSPMVTERATYILGGDMLTFALLVAHGAFMRGSRAQMAPTIPAPQDDQTHSMGQDEPPPAPPRPPTTPPLPKPVTRRPKLTKGDSHAGEHTN